MKPSLDPLHWSRLKFYPRLLRIGWERYKELDPATQRQVKGIVKGRIRGDHYKAISEAVGLNTYYVEHYTKILGLPSTRAFRMRKVAKLRYHGLSAPEVAARMGLTVRAVNILRAHMRLPPFAREKRPPRHRSPLRGHIATLHAQGLPAAEIAERLGVSRQTVHIWIKRITRAA
ncbi:helix-turn-helix domain-containing protein [Dyella sp. 2HG41-7]|uniref:helix-turn-helix domain-containing protein n=1 Tax=Dyella sp. 2HG41-7 TaxID=2883239 RepID=UPI001F238B51|nr:helix-turn-helix domain-containing protein [Dyella sp. 2HG41-7]